MVERYSMLRSACSGPRGEELRPLRRRKSGSETPELQSMSCEESQKLRSLEGQPRVAERGGEHRSQRLHVPVRHGLKFWSLRPRLPTARCSHFPHPWPGTCRTQHRRSCVHRNYIVGMGPRLARGKIVANGRLLHPMAGGRVQWPAFRPMASPLSDRCWLIVRSSDRRWPPVQRRPSNAVNLANPVNDPPQGAAPCGVRAG